MDIGRFNFIPPLIFLGCTHKLGQTHSGLVSFGHCRDLFVRCLTATSAILCVQLERIEINGRFNGPFMVDGV